MLTQSEAALEGLKEIAGVFCSQSIGFSTSSCGALRRDGTGRESACVCSPCVGRRPDERMPAVATKSTKHALILPSRDGIVREGWLHKRGGSHGGRTP